MMPCPVCWGAALVCQHCASRGEVEDVHLGGGIHLSDLLRSETARAKSIPNAPREGDVVRMQELAIWLLDPIQRQLGPLLVTSGYRSAALNAAVGGSATSAHLSGWGADVVRQGVPPEAIMEHLYESSLQWDQAILYRGHVHLGLRRPATGEQRRQLLRAGTWERWEPARGVA